MAVRFEAPTEEHILGERTFFLSDEAAGQTELSVENVEGFSANDYICLGEIGEEQSELLQISTVDTDNNTITVASATSFKHYAGDPIIHLEYNQRKVYRATSKTGTYSAAGITETIEVDNPLGTLIEDSGGSSSYWYKAVYLNSTTGDETSTDDAVAVQGGDTSAYVALGEIRDEAGFGDNYHVGNSVIDFYRDAAESEVNGVIATRYTLPLDETPSVIEYITRILAAGMLLTKEYGEEAEGLSKDGKRKLKEARDLLKMIRTGALKLIGADSSELDTSSAAYMGGFPDDSTGTDKTTQGTKDDPPNIEIGMEF